MTTVKTTIPPTTTSATVSVRRPIQVILPDECGGTRLSTFVSQALLRHGPVWLWRQAMKTGGSN